MGTLSVADACLFQDLNQPSENRSSLEIPACPTVYPKLGECSTRFQNLHMERRLCSLQQNLHSRHQRRPSEIQQLQEELLVCSDQFACLAKWALEELALVQRARPLVHIFLPIFESRQNLLSASMLVVLWEYSLAGPKPKDRLSMVQRRTSSFFARKDGLDPPKKTEKYRVSIETLLYRRQLMSCWSTTRSGPNPGPSNHVCNTPSF